ncbi:hypothetical protein Tco_0465212 [Tanacetum coccineum]
MFILISIPPTVLAVIGELEEVIVRGLGFQFDDLKITAFDLKDALVVWYVAYEIDLEIDNQVLSLKLLDDVHKWQHVDLPILQVDDQATNMSNDNGLIQDAKKTKLSLPENNIRHVVEDGNLRKVILADGAVVNVKGAKSVSLLRLIDLDLPLTKTKNKFAIGFFTLVDRLKHASHTHSLLVSLSIVGPTSLTSPKPSVNKLKLNHCLVLDCVILIDAYDMLIFAYLCLCDIEELKVSQVPTGPVNDLPQPQALIKA